MTLLRLPFVKTFAFFAGACLLGSAAFGQAQPGQPAQPQPGQPGQPGANPAGGDPQQRMQDFIKSRDDRLKTLLGATDDEFAVLKPRIDNLQMLQTRQVMQGFRMMMGGGQNNGWRGRSSNPAGDNANDPNKPANGQDPNAAKPANPFAAMFADTPALLKAQELQTALEAKDTPTETLKGKLAELRAARKQAKEEITRAQEELRGLCTVRQEATLVMMGVLE